VRNTHGRDVVYTSMRFLEMYHLIESVSVKNQIKVDFFLGYSEDKKQKY